VASVTFTLACVLAFLLFIALVILLGRRRDGHFRSERSRSGHHVIVTMRRRYPGMHGGHRNQWQAVCACGWAGEWGTSRDHAEAESEEHIREHG
jgi:hypothetical protein